VTDDGSTPGTGGDDATHDLGKDDPYTDGSVPADADLASDDEETNGAATSD
jgi:hypothetical protein